MLSHYNLEPSKDTADVSSS